MISTYQLLAQEFQANPFPFYARMRAEGLSRIEPGAFLAMSRYSDVAAALRNTAVFSSAGFSRAWEPEWLGPNPCAHSMHSLDPPEHTRMRNLVNPAFLPAVIERTAPFVQSLAESSVGRFASRGEAEIVSEVALPVTAGMIGSFLRLDPALHGKFKGWSDAMLSITPQPRSPEHAEYVRASIHEEAGYFRTLIEERRRAPGDDMVSLLVHAKIDGERLTDKELVSFLSLLLVGGMETAANMITKSMVMLTEREDILDRLRADLSLVPRFVDEMLRYDPSVHSLFRSLKKDTVIAGTEVPAGSTVLLLIGSANHDESQFPNPDVFDMDRDHRGSLAFGLGPHFCIGMSLAKLEARLTLTEILRRFRRFEHLEPTIAWNHTMTVRKVDRLRLRGIPA
jgi:hypothetical protein